MLLGRGQFMREHPRSLKTTGPSKDKSLENIEASKIPGPRKDQSLKGTGALKI